MKSPCSARAFLSQKLLLNIGVPTLVVLIVFSCRSYSSYLYIKVTNLPTVGVTQLYEFLILFTYFNIYIKLTGCIWKNIVYIRLSDSIPSL
jgi:hypothetical protein